MDINRYIERKYKREKRPGDWRTDYGIDKARVIHSSAFRRLQGKTQVMGIGENDFHRTRLTHSLEVGQIGLGLLEGLKKRENLLIPEALLPLLDDAHDLAAAACYAHDLGHPPFGHAGERALQSKMYAHGGFEGNAQTVRILTFLSKYDENPGINPTRRTLLSVLKYPVKYAMYNPLNNKERYKNKPPKCYYGDDSSYIDWALDILPKKEREIFASIGEDGKPMHMSFDASLMECADDIAYCAHDLEDIVARGIVEKDILLNKIRSFFDDRGPIAGSYHEISFDDFSSLFKGSRSRKKIIGKIINFLMTNTTIVEKEEFSDPLFRFNLNICGYCLASANPT